MADYEVVTGGRPDPDALQAALARSVPRRVSSQRCPRRAAVAVVIAPRAGPPAGGAALALIRRAEHPQDPWSGQMGFPGGRAEPEDLDSWGTAIREAEEEVGLRLASARRLGALSELQAMSGGRSVGLAIAPVVFWLERPAPLTPTAEVAEALWVPFATLLDPARSTTVVRTFAGRRYELPGVDVGCGVVWGLTWRMLHALLSRLDGASAGAEGP